MLWDKFKVLYTLMRLAMAVTALFALGALVYGIAVAFTPGDALSVSDAPGRGLTIENSAASVQVGNMVPLQVLPGGIRAGYSAKALQLVYLAAATAVTLLPAGVVIYGFLRILGSVRRGESPFQPGHAQWLRRIGWILALMGLLRQTVVALALYAAVFRGFCAGISLGQVNGGLVMSGAALLLFAHIFDYGVGLQREADETL